MKQQVRKIASILMMAVGALALAVDVLAHSQGVLLVLAALLFAVGLYILPTKKHTTVVHVMFVLPLLLAFVVTIIYPFLSGIFYSFTDWNGVGFKQVVGLANYKTIFTSVDFVYSFVLTIVFSLVSVLVVNFIAFSLALLCTSRIRGAQLYRAAFFVPNLIGGIVLGYVWQFIFNRVFTALFAGAKSMLADPGLAMLAVVLVFTWQYAGYIMMIYITGIQSVPQDVLEAAEMDGASRWDKLRRVTIPLLANTFTICLFLTLVNSFKQFDLNYALTNGGPSCLLDGNVLFSTELLTLDIYKEALVDYQYSTGQAKAVIFSIVLAGISLLQLRYSRKKEVAM